MKNLLLSLLIMPLLVGCASTAKLANFPGNIDELDLVRLSKQSINPDHPSWNKVGSSEYLITVKEKNSVDLSIILSSALNMTGFSIKENSVKLQKIVGKRGPTLDEWSSIAAVYYKQKSQEQYYVYIRVDITQDVTGDASDRSGGWKRNRAYEISKIICQRSSCVIE